MREVRWWSSDSSCLWIFSWFKTFRRSILTWLWSWCLIWRRCLRIVLNKKKKKKFRSKNCLKNHSREVLHKKSQRPIDELAQKITKKKKHEHAVNDLQWYETESVTLKVHKITFSCSPHTKKKRLMTFRSSLTQPRGWKAHFFLITNLLTFFVYFPFFYKENLSQIL